MQIRFILNGNLDPALLRSVWDASARKLTNASAPVVAHGNGNGNGNGNGAHTSAAKPTAASTAPVPWEDYDLRGISAEDAANWVASFLQTDRSREILPHRGFGMRCFLIRKDADTSELIWSFHPALFDDASQNPFVQTVRAAYEEEAHGLNHAQQQNGRVVWTPVTPLEASSNGAQPQPAQANSLPNGTGRNGTNGKRPQRENRRDAVEVSAHESEASPDALEQLKTIWKSVLKVPEVRPEDDFFNLGGHSLLAARLLARIEESLGIELPLASLLEAPTLADQARLLSGKAGESARNRAGGAAPASAELPFFFLGGDPTFRPLSERLSRMHAFHSLGLQPSVIREFKRPPTLAEIAQYFVSAIRERQPQGPYMLGGWCAHGLLAFETARQLREQGQEVALIIMLETVNPVRMRAYAKWKRAISRMQLKLHLLQFEYVYLQDLTRSQRLDYIARRVSNKLSKIKTGLRASLGLRTSGPNVQGDRNALETLYAAAAAYDPKPYQGKVVLVRSTERTFGFAHDLRLGWGDMLGGGLEVRESPGNHYTIYMGANVDALAAQMTESIAAAEIRAQQHAMSAVAR